MAFNLGGLELQIAFDGRDLIYLINIVKRLERESGSNDVRKSLGNDHAELVELLQSTKGELLELNKNSPQTLTKEISELQNLNSLINYLTRIMVTRNRQYFENMRLFYNHVLSFLEYFEKMLTTACKEEHRFLADLIRLRRQMHEMLDRYTNPKS